MIFATIKVAKAFRKLKLQIIGEIFGQKGGNGGTPPKRKPYKSLVALCLAKRGAWGSTPEKKKPTNRRQGMLASIGGCGGNLPHE